MCIPLNLISSLLNHCMKKVKSDEYVSVSIATCRYFQKAFLNCWGKGLTGQTEGYCLLVPIENLTNVQCFSQNISVFFCSKDIKFGVSFAKREINNTIEKWIIEPDYPLHCSRPNVGWVEISY